MKTLLGLLIRTTLVLVLVLAGGVLYVWQNAERMLVDYVGRELRQNGLQLENLDWRRQLRLPLHINEMTISSPGFAFEFKGISIVPTTDFDYQVHTDAIKIRMLEGSSNATGELDAETLQRTLTALIPVLPTVGMISRLALCVPVCYEGTLSWRREHEFIDVLLTVPQLNLSGRMQLSGQSLVASLFSADEPQFLFNVAFAKQDHQLAISGAAYVQAQRTPLSYRFVEPLAAEVDLNLARMSFEFLFPMDAALSIAGLSEHLSGKLDILSNQRWQADIGDLRLASSSVLNASVRLSKSKQDLVINVPLTVDIESATFGQAELAIGEPFQCMLQKPDTQGSRAVTCQLGRMTLVGQPVFKEMSVDATVSKLSLESSLDALMDDLIVKAEFSSRLTDDYGMLVDASGNFEYANDVLSIAATDSTVAGMPGVTLTLEQNFGTSLGGMKANYSGSASHLALILARLQLHEVELLSGAFEASVQANWNMKVPQQLTFSSALIGSDWDVDIDSYVLRGGNFKASMSGWPSIETTVPASMHWQSINVGFLLQQVEMTFDVALNPLTGDFRLVGDTLHSTAMGGNVRSDDYAYDSTTASGHLNLDLENLSLNEILALEKEKLTSEGRLNGSVPIQIRDGKVSVTAGNIAAIEPGGFIKYEPSPAVRSMMDENEEIALVIDSLSDFRYHGLDAQLKYSEDGILIANVALKGSNPAFQDGREIHFNLSLEENVATLLESLRLGDDIANQFEKRMNTGSQ